MKRVRLIIFDVDGVLTDGGVYFGANGEEQKRFHIADGLGMRLAHLAGIHTAVISGRESNAVSHRMQGLGVSDILQGVSDKRSAVESLKAKYALEDAEVAFVGDDLNDLPAFDAVGVRIAVANAVSALKQRADYITGATGGGGAAREAVEAILDAQGVLKQVIDAYVCELGGVQ
jgi:3-deoxy-D-manno-octulosonate 8-phosphate phosphatase (KDO 8-P phosphatase)